jgi:predicted Zn-dependent peptidase
MKEDIKETRLENGLIVLTDRMPGVRSATLGFFYRVGSRNEPDELNGVTHFIEHCVFKGTSKRSALDIAIEQDRLGGNLDAFTTHEETGFVIKVIDDKLDAAFDLLSDMLVNSRFDDGDLKNEQQVIIEEIKLNEDSPEDSLSDIFHSRFFPGHPLGMNIAGTPETVKSFDHGRTSEYHSRAFTPENLVIVAAGTVEHDELVSRVRSTDFSRPVSPGSQLKLELQTPVTSAPLVIEQRDDLEQAHVMIATPIVGATDKRRYAADLLGSILGGGSSSRLWQKVREERGLVYSIGAGAVMFRDIGVFSVSAAASPEHVEEITEIVVDELRSVVNDGVRDEELELHKDQARAAILLSLEDSASRASALASSELVHGRQISVEETLAGIDAVTTEDIRKLAAEYFRSDSLAFAALGDLAGINISRDDLVLG